MTDKRVLLAAGLSTLFLVWYARALFNVQPLAPVQESTVAPQEPPAQPDTPEPLVLRADEATTTIESNQLLLEIGSSSGAIRKVVLKAFKDPVTGGPLNVRTELPVFSPAMKLPVGWKEEIKSNTTIHLSGRDNSGNNHHISYSLDAHNPIVTFELSTEYRTEQTDMIDRAFIFSWARSDEIEKGRNILESIVLEKHGDTVKYRKVVPSPKGERTVPRGTVLVSLSERYFCSSLRSDEELSVAILPATDQAIAAKLAAPKAWQQSTKFSIYFGPRDYFHLKRSGFEQAFPIGLLGKIGLALLLVLSWIASLTGNYGFAIVLFGVLITCLTAPFTLISFKSMKKMQQLKPHVDRIMAKHKGNAAVANKEVFSLYKEHRVSPLSGCLPMLMQMPIFIALFNALSHFIELRGANFLWIDDLSQPDRLILLPFSLPFFGKELNLLPILMAFAMYAQTAISQKNMPSSGDNPTAKMFSGPMMSIVFGIMFYHFQSGLVLYWMTNSLISILWYKLAK